MSFNQGSTEGTVIAIWAEALQKDGGISADSNFFELGGDSLAMMIVLFRINEELGVELSPLALLEASTPVALSALIAAMRDSSSGDGGATDCEVELPHDLRS